MDRGNAGVHYLLEQTILEWTSKLQIKNGVPYVYFIRHLAQNHMVDKGKEVLCKLVMVDNCFRIIIDLATPQHTPQSTPKIPHVGEYTEY